MPIVMLKITKLKRSSDYRTKHSKRLSATLLSMHTKPLRARVRLLLFGRSWSFNITLFFQTIRLSCMSSFAFITYSTALLILKILK